MGTTDHNYITYNFLNFFIYFSKLPSWWFGGSQFCGLQQQLVLRPTPLFVQCFRFIVAEIISPGVFLIYSKYKKKKRIPTVSRTRSLSRETLSLA